MLHKILFSLLICGIMLMNLGAAQNAVALRAWNFAEKESITAKECSPLSEIREYAPGKTALAVVADGTELLDKQYGVSSNSCPEDIPAGPFAFECRFRLSEELLKAHPKSSIFYLIDKKIYHYASEAKNAHTGYLMLLKKHSNGAFAIEVWIGNGTKTASIVTNPLTLSDGNWHDCAFTYDGKRTLRIYLDGECTASNSFDGFGTLAQNSVRLTIGDRSSSTHLPFHGWIASATLYDGIPEKYAAKAALAITSYRTVFYRFDKRPNVMLHAENPALVPFRNLRLLRGETTIALPGELKPGESADYTATVDVTGKPGKYTAEFRLEYESDGKPESTECRFAYDLMPRDTPYLPVVLWNGAGDRLDLLKEIGFTHDLVRMSNENATFKKGSPASICDDTRRQQEARWFNDRARMGLHPSYWIVAGSWLGQQLKDDQFFRVNRKGARIANANGDVTQEIYRKFTDDFGRSVAQNLGDFLAADLALIHSEVRDNSAISFHPENIAAAEAALGRTIPECIRSKNGVDYRTIPDFPANRVLPDDDDILRFYRWFWKTGDGWNDLHTIASNALKSTGRNDIRTFFDPVVRAPSLWGSGGKVDAVSQWTYAYPDPIKVGEATDEVIAMADGTPGQQPMTMTQIIWYRNKTAPIAQLPENPADRSDWEKKDPEAPFITIAPDALEIAFWSMLSRPVKAIMYHGWNSLVGVEKQRYTFTNAETPKRLKRLISTVVKPLGPTLLAVRDDVPPKVALLQSFASQIYDGAGTWGWSDSWEADVHLVLQWAGLQPKILYDETILRDGLDPFQVLVMPKCSVLTQKVAAAVQEFQQRGGIVVSDETLTPAILPDYVMPIRARTRNAQADKAALQKMAQELRTALDGYIDTPFRTSNADLVARMRMAGDAKYLFLMNDKRTYGDYLGKYGLVMEQGLPNEGTVILPQKGGAVYDLVAGARIATKQNADGSLAWPVSLAPAEGRLYLITPTPLGKLHLEAPQTATRGGEFAIRCMFDNTSGTPVAAVIPVELVVESPEGRIEGSGFHAAENGILDVVIAPAWNDVPGIWKITARNLANGDVAETTLTVK